MPGHFEPRAGLHARRRPDEDTGEHRRALLLANAAIMRGLCGDTPSGLIEEQPRSEQTL